MAVKRKTPLSRLFRNFVLGMFTAVVCSWITLSLRLEYVQDLLSLKRKGEVLLFLDYILLAGAFFGLIIALLALPALMARISRIASLGEDKWCFDRSFKCIKPRLSSQLVGEPRFF